MASIDDGLPSQEWNDLAQSPSASAEEVSSQQPANIPKTTSPAPGTSFGLPELTRTDSDRTSLKSHVSLPVIGTLPLGSLQVHKATEPPRPQQPEATGRVETSDMPPLEGDDQAPAGPSPPGLHTGARGGRGRGDDGDAFVILDLPGNSTVGCDAKAIGTGASGFKGIRGIPPGPHFVWVSQPGAISRSGYWFVTAAAAGAGRGRVRVKQWDRFNEVLVPPASRFEARDLSENMAGLYPQLVPHEYGDAAAAAAAATRTGKNAREPGGGGAGRPLTTAASSRAEPDIEAEDAAQLWRRLTSSVDEKVLARVTGQGQRDGVSEWLVDTSDSARGDEPSFPHTAQVYRAVAGAGELDFLFPEGDVDLAALGREGQGQGQQPVAAAAAAAAASTPDTTASILRLLDTPGTGVAGPDLVGEMQLAFLTGLHLSNLSCVDQWWHLVLKVVLRAHGLALLRPGLARALVQTLHAQMVYNEKYIAGGGPGTGTRSTGGKGGEGDDYDDDDGGGDDEFGFERQARHEYGGADAQGTSILDVVPGNKRKLREALTLFKRRLDGALLSPPPGERITDEQGAVGRAFVDLEAWFWKLGWDLRVDAAVGERRKRSEGDDDDDGGGDDDDDDDYQPVIVDLDENGREVGLVSFN